METLYCGTLNQVKTHLFPLTVKPLLSEKKSKFLPYSNLNPAIFRFSKPVENVISKLVQNKKPSKMDLSTSELEAFNFEKRDDIIILLRILRKEAQ